MDAPTGPANNEGAIFIYSTDTVIALKVYEDSTTHKTFFKSYGTLNEDDLNHYVFTFDASAMSAVLYINGENAGTLSTAGTATSYGSHTFNAIYVAGNPSNNNESLEGRLDQLGIWDTTLNAAEAEAVYHDGRRKDLLGVRPQNLVHWYKLGDEPGLPAIGSDLSTFATFKDRGIRTNTKSSIFSATNLTVTGPTYFTVEAGLPTDNKTDTIFWNDLTSSIESNVATYTASYVDNTTFATFTVTNKTSGPAGNNTTLSEDSTLVNSLETTTSGGIDQSGTTDGSFVVIGSKKFEADDDGTADTASIFYIQNTGSNTQFWNALSQSIKDNTNFDTVNVSGVGDTRLFSITSSIRQASDNSAISSVNGDFSIVANTDGGADDTGAVDGHYINLRPTTDGADQRLFTVDRDNDGSNTSTQKFIHSVQSSNANWWNALSASIKAEGFDVNYVADSPSAGTASFTITSYVTGAAGNNGSITLFSGTTFTNISGTSFAGGLDASGSLAGNTITVSGSVFTLINTGSPSATQVLTTGSGVTSETMFEDLRAKIQAATPYTVTTASSGIPRLFELTASLTGSGRSPSLARSGTTFTLVNTGSDGVEELGAEAGDSITIDGDTFVIVSGAPGAKQISFTGSSAAIRNALSQSIKDNTVFDNIVINDLGNGYHRFNLTASVVGTGSNALFTTNSSGVRDTFQNLAGAAGGIDSAGIVDGDSLLIRTTRFILTASAPGSDTSTTKYIITTGSSTQIWDSLETKIESHTPYSVNRTAASGLAKFNLTASSTGSVNNTTLQETGSSFTSLVHPAGGTDETGMRDGDRISFASKSFVLTSSAPSDTSNIFYITKTGSSSAIWSALKSKIQSNTPYTVATASAGGNAVFSLTASATGSSSNSTITRTPNPGRSFFSVNNLAGGVNFVADIYGPDNVIMRPRTDLTGSERNIATRFSAPGGPEIQSYGYLDAYTSTFSVHNAMPFRNLSVLGPSSGESGTIRVEDHLGLRRGLKTLRGLHKGRFGIDSQYGAVTATAYPSSGSFNKQHRNNSRVMTSRDFDASIRFNETSTETQVGLITAETAYNSSSFPTTGGKSFSFWINFDDPEIELDQFIFDGRFDNSNKSIWILHSFRNGLLTFYAFDPSGNNKQYKFTSPMTQTNRWYHVVITWNGNFSSNPTVYVDATSIGSPTVSGTGTGNTLKELKKIQIGDIFSNSTAFELKGRLSHFVMYSTNFTTTGPINTLYNNGSPLSTGLPSSSDIIDFWLLGNEAELSGKRLEGVGAQIDGATTISSITGSQTAINSTSAELPTIAKGVNYVGIQLITEDKYDNAFINSPIPRSELQYSWIHAATTGSDGDGVRYGAAYQKIVGYAPRDGILGKKDDFSEAIIFPSASSIYSV